MVKLEDLGEVISTDVLVAGSGIAGLPAAIKAKETSPERDVLIVDKATVGWAGLAPKGGGVFWCIAPEDNLDKFVEYHVKNFGYYLNDQELLNRNSSHLVFLIIILVILSDSSLILTNITVRAGKC